MIFCSTLILTRYVPLSISHPDEGNFSNRQHRSVQTMSNDNTEAVLADHCFRTVCDTIS